MRLSAERISISPYVPVLNFNLMLREWSANQLRSTRFGKRAQMERQTKLEARVSLAVED